MMKRFCFGANAVMQEHDHGAWVNWADAEAEIEKARKANVESYQNGYKAGLLNGSVIVTNTKEANDAVRADEREEILKILEAELTFRVHPTALDPVLARIRSRGEPKPVQFKNFTHGPTDWGHDKPPKIEHVDITLNGTFRDQVMKALNALIDAENARRE